MVLFCSLIKKKPSIHWQHVRVTQAVESKFLTEITLIDNRKFNCIIETWYQVINVTVFQLKWEKKIILYRSNALPTNPPFTEPKILIQTYQRGGSMHFKVVFYQWVWFSMEGPPIFLVFKEGEVMSAISTLLWQNILEVPIIWIRQWVCSVMHI
jgi:hypothetical protein